MWSRRPSRQVRTSSVVDTGLRPGTAEPSAVPGVRRHQPGLWRRLWRRQSPIHGRQALAGWLFATPALVGLGVFLVLPILFAFWVSFREWSGLAPVETSTPTGAENYRDLLTDSGIVQSDFAKSLRNNLYYVLGVVPAQTALAFLLAVIVNAKLLKGKTFFRTAFYFPSVTSSIRSEERRVGKECRPRWSRHH